MIDGTIFQILGAGGDAAMMVLLYAFWRLDRRLLKIELHIFNGKKK